MAYKTQLFHLYFKQWITIYKQGAVSKVTLDKYLINCEHLKKIAPQLKLYNLNRQSYQQVLNEYAQTHEKRTTLDFHHQLRSSLQDAFDDQIIKRDPTRKAIIKGTVSRKRKKKFLHKEELKQLLKQLNIDGNLTLDYLILLLAKTGLRFSEAIALIPKDFDFNLNQISITKTWSYKNIHADFASTKNKSSERTIVIDKILARSFKVVLEQNKLETPIFLKPGKRIHNDTSNDHLEKLCKQANIPSISLHGLRHTHASILLYSGVSVGSVARRLGHANITTTQKTYLHIIRELEVQDNEKVLKAMQNF
ncbi:MAG: site-specific integrase [Micrococcaceae bacterium]